MKIFLLNFIYLKNGMFATWSYKDSNGDEPIASKTDIRNWEFSRERWYLRMHLVHSFFGAQTKRPKTKRPKGQNVPRDKTSQETKRPKEKKFYISISNFSKTDFVPIFLKMGRIC